MQIKGFGPQLKLRKQKNSAVGLDIGSDYVKLVELKSEGEAVKLSKIDSAKIALTSGSASDQRQTIKNAIVNLFAKNQIKSKQVVLGTPGQSVFIKFLDVLPLGNEKIDRTIRFEAWQQIPFPLEKIDWDAHIFEGGTDKKLLSYRVLLVAIKRDILESQKDLAEEIGLRPTILDVSTLGVYNAARFNQDYDENKLNVILDIGAQSTDLLIIKETNFWMRSFAIGGDSINSALRKRFNIGFAEAEELKQKMNIESPDIKEAVVPVLEDLQGEINRSIEYYCFQQKQKPPAPSAEESSANETENNKIDTIILSGGSSHLSGLEKFLTESFSCQVKLAQPFKMLQIDEPIKKKLLSQDAILFSQAVGLALRGLSKSFININLLKEQIKAKKLAQQKVLYGAGSVILALVILFSASTFMRQDYREKSLRLQRLKGWLNIFSTYGPQISKLQEKEELFSQRVNILKGLAVNRDLWLKVLAEMQDMLSDDLWLTDFKGTISFNTEEELVSKLDLEGKAVSYDGVNNFVSHLKSSPLFAEVKPLSSAFVQEEPAAEQEQARPGEKVEVVKFSISMKVMPLTGE